MTAATPPSSYLQRVGRAPAIRALLIQCVSMPLTLLTIYLLARLHFPLNEYSAVLLQGGWAGLLTWRLGLARWWRWIQLLFPATLMLALALQLPPWLFLLAFLLSLGWYWSTFRTQVPYYPSTPEIWDAVRQVLPADQPVRMIDIGSGLGGLVLYLARQRPRATCIGIELAPLPWLYSRLRAMLGGSRAQFLLGDYEKLDFAQFQLVFAYLSPAAMPALWHKASAEMLAGSMLVSYEFAIEGKPANQTIYATETGKPLYIWYF